MRKKVADKKEVQAFLTSVLRSEEAELKDRLKVSEYLLKLAGEEPEAPQDVQIRIRVVE